MTLKEEYQKETGMAALHLGLYYAHYVQWLEAKAQKPEVSEEALEKARQDGYEAGWQDSANHIANTL